MPLVDPSGEPLQSSTIIDPSLRGGWILSGGIGTGQDIAPDVGIYGVSRNLERRKSRIAWFLNPVYWSAIEVMAGYVVGDTFTWGDHEDRRIRESLDEWAALNDLPSLVERFWTEFTVDGENATVWVGDLRPNEPGQVAFLDVDTLSMDATVTRGVTRVSAPVGGNEKEEWFQGEFIWSAWQPVYNDPRGWPMAMRAVDACLAYVDLLNSRVKAQRLNGRINAVYKALVNTATPDGGLEQQRQKAAIYGQVPRDGAVLTLAKDRITGESEELDFLDLGRGASEAADDARLLRLVVAQVIGVPEHYLGEGGGVTRTTADAMGDPARKSFSKRQAKLRSWLDRMYRAELVRRFGPNQTYFRTRYRVTDNGRSRVRERVKVPVGQVEIPWSLPNLTSDQLSEITRMVDVAVSRRVMSMQTARSKFGLDPAVEWERIRIETTEGDVPPTGTGGKRGAEGPMPRQRPDTEEDGQPIGGQDVDEQEADE